MPRLYLRQMRFHTYSKFSPEAADAVDLQGLLDKLADFLLQSGFAGGQSFNPYFDDFDSEPDRSDGRVVGIVPGSAAVVGWLGTVGLLSTT